VIPIALGGALAAPAISLSVAGFAYVAIWRVAHGSAKAVPVARIAALTLFDTVPLSLKVPGYEGSTIIVPCPD